MTDGRATVTPYVDSHVHFWDPDELNYEWLAGTPLDRPYLLSDLQEASSGLELEKIVFVQADAAAESALAEVDWINRLAEEEPRIHAIVADAALETGEAIAEHLDRLCQYPRVKAVRRLIQGKGLGYATQDSFVRGVQMVGSRGLRFDICIYHPQMADAIELVDRCPDMRFVLDHIGKPDIAAGLKEPWMEQIGALAERQNVWCKLSGMITEADMEKWQLEDLRPYAQRVLEVFGIERVMFGSDWPVVTLAGHYRRWYESAGALISDLSADEQHRLLYENASAFYGI